jgi:signal transduction histidine kinase
MLVREPPSAFEERERLMAQIEHNLQRDIDGLATGLDPVTRQRWDALAPEVERHRKAYEDAATLVHTGRRTDADALLDEDAPSATVFHDALDALEEVHRVEMLKVIEETRQRTSRVRILTGLMGGSFIAGMLIIWGVVVMKLRSQRRQLDEYTTRLETANADLDAFAGRVAYDLRGALAPLAMSPPLMRRFAAGSPRIMDIADRTERCSRRALSLVESLLAFARASQTEGHGERTTVATVVDDVLEEIAPLAADVDASIQILEMPDVEVALSANLLHTTLANLCSNAVKFLEGCPERRVTITARRDGAACRIDVADTGPGIPKEARSKIFEPFYRVKGTRIPGTGIGLATVRRILDARGGRIHVESTEGRGSRFSIWLPLVQTPEDSRHRYPRSLSPAVHH